jgi:hypothetical protein
MAARKRGRGNGDVRDLTVEILKSIRNELVQLREETSGLRGEVVQLRGEVVQLRGEVVQLGHDMGGEVAKLREENQATRRATVKGFDAVTQRIDHLIDFSGERWRDHEGRLKKIEQHLKIA